MSMPSIVAASRMAPLTTRPAQPWVRARSAIGRHQCGVDRRVAVDHQHPPGLSSPSTSQSSALSWKQRTVVIPTKESRLPNLRNWVSQLRTSSPILVDQVGGRDELWGTRGMNP